MVKIRLTRMGSINKPFYRIVAVDSRNKRDGKYIENIGYYDPKHNPAIVKIEEDLALKWLKVGAQPSQTVRSLFKNAGILQKMHEFKYVKKETATE
ncbi:MAG: 30S ribosomal protein S16 [Candidatus Cloacimonadales bacterium]|jgi:small subunit ribosomal protein S16|nr:30S ribosomal protein S16 [Candidatus Cloacimonadota bacterium]MDD2651386.1 30S ribosomal protein S16 [Candidatus Cloacimonadota bacterium]MDD3500912.1 30S ribosomal protein S16 [Candidatus Cloacimonadota bacterium]MDX9976988.1 30S ribosomal protein S16 [Candidatus Cloacimonadales bacterium]